MPSIVDPFNAESIVHLISIVCRKSLIKCWCKHEAHLGNDILFGTELLVLLPELHTSVFPKELQYQSFILFIKNQPCRLLNLPKHHML